ncbi:hypothetical protein BDF19DRAFT_433344 [Syncephalis fuscata]|nr:hypothetical protein BDF19DRAFT_433344 [Syncephalis fuscata]
MKPDPHKQRASRRYQTVAATSSRGGRRGTRSDKPGKWLLYLSSLFDNEEDLLGVDELDTDEARTEAQEAYDISQLLAIIQKQEHVALDQSSFFQFKDEQTWFESEDSSQSVDASGLQVEYGDLETALGSLSLWQQLDIKASVTTDLSLQNFGDDMDLIPLDSPIIAQNAITDLTEALKKRRDTLKSVPNTLNTEQSTASDDNADNEKISSNQTNPTRNVLTQVSKSPTINKCEMKGADTSEGSSSMITTTTTRDYTTATTNSSKDQSKKSANMTAWLDDVLG